MQEDTYFNFTPNRMLSTQRKYNILILTSGFIILMPALHTIYNSLYQHNQVLYKINYCLIHALPQDVALQ